MKKYNKHFTKEKYEKHLLWIKGEEGGERLDLFDKDLRFLNFKNVNLSKADLSWANLSGANLSWANLEDANLIRANLEDAYLKYANLRYANLKYANLKNTILPDYLSHLKKDDKNLIKQIADIVLKDRIKLNMEEWHTCNTMHCLAGWAIHLTNNYKAEENSSSYLVGRLLLGDEVAKMFNDDNEEVIGYLESIK